MAEQIEPESKKEPKAWKDLSATAREAWYKIDGEKKSEEEFCSWMKKQVADHPVVKNNHGTWQELIEWENGQQFALWDAKKRAVLPIELNIRKKRVVINLMKPLNETIEGKLNFNHSVVGVPNSSEDVDIFGSYVATRLLNYNDYTIGMDELMEEMKDDLLRPGTSCIKWWWDQDLNGWIAPKKNPENKAQEPGDVNGEVIPIFNIRQDPTAKTPKQLRWVMELKEVTRQAILDRFLTHGLKTTDLVALRENQAAKEEGRYIVSTEVDQDEDTYILREWWENSNRWYKKGRYVVTCADRVLYAGSNPSPDGALPYFFFFFKKSKYAFWANGPLYYIQDLQREFNRMISLISEHIEAWRPKMAVGHGALKRAASMIAGSFELVEVDFSRGEPRPMNMPEVSAQVTAYRDFLLASVDRVSNVHEVSYARLPQYASRAPASLYSMMLEQENLKLSPMVGRINKTLVDMANFRLKLMDQHYKRPRMAKIIGKQRHATIEYFDRVDLNENFDVRLETGVSINQSNTIQTRLLIEMWEKGIITQEERLKILEFLPLGTAEYELRPDLADKERAIRENQAFLDEAQDELPTFLNFLEGQWLPPATVFKHDNHEVHLDQHTTLTKTEEFTKLPDEVQLELIKHIEQHYVWYNLALQSQQMPPGSPMTPGAQGGPQMGGEPMIEGTTQQVPAVGAI